MCGVDKNRNKLETFVEKIKNIPGIDIKNSNFDLTPWSKCEDGSLFSMYDYIDKDGRRYYWYQVKDENGKYQKYQIYINEKKNV